jgi:tight adherence protein C
MAVKLLFPMILFIFPTILIVTAGPAGITLAKFFGNG